MISGMRKPSPISISSPRDTITSPPRASAASVTSTAAAQLFTTMTASAPVRRRSNRAQWTSRLPRAPAATSYSRLVYSVATRRNSSITSRESGARPRFVCRITPEALMTGFSDGRSSLSTASTVRLSISAASTTRSSAVNPAMMSRRTSASTPLSVSSANARSTSLHNAARRGRNSSSSTEGTRRSKIVWSAFGTGLAGRVIASFHHSGEARRNRLQRLYGTARSASARCPMRSVPPPSPLTPAKSAPRMMIRGAGSMATIDEELAQLERDIRQLKIEYDMYFGGGRKRPPNEVEWRIELLVKRYSERGGELKFAQRFRFNNLCQTYAKYKDIFRKRVAQREEGKVQRHFGAAARAIEAERARTQPETSSKGSSAATAAVESRGFRMVCSEPEKEPRKVDELYDAFLRAKQEAGEETSKLNRAGFNEFVRKTTKDLQTKKNCRDVEYVVETVDGQVKLKAVVKS